MPGRRMCLFLGMGTENVRLPSISGPPLNKQASCLGCRSCCLEIVRVDVDRGHTGNMISCPHKSHTLQEVELDENALSVEVL